jgi:hypothetical protein
MGFRKRLVGVKEHSFEILVITGSVIRDYQVENKVEDDEIKELWELWEWMAFQELQNGTITQEQFIQIYGILSKLGTQFEFEYQKNDQEIGRRFALLYSDIQKVLYPSLPVAFLPAGYGTEIWPLTGKPVRNVRIKEGFGDTIPQQIIKIVEQHGLKIEQDSSQELLIYLCSEAFVKTLIFSNDKNRTERLGLRTSAYELLPYFICFDLFKFKKSE